MSHGRHRPKYQLFKRRYVLMRDWDSDHRGWWRLSWPNGRAKHEEFAA